MPDNENLLNAQELEDSVSIDNLTQSPDLDGDDVVVLVHENNGVKSTYKAILRSIANFINKLLHYSSDLHTQNDTIIGAINELADGGGGSADIISTASGTIATFSDGGDNIPVKSLVTDITATQAGTGTPSPDNIRTIIGFDTVDVSVTGKNLFSGAVVSSDIDTDGQIISRSSAYWRSDKILIGSNKKITFSVFSNPNYATGSFNYRGFDSSGVMVAGETFFTGIGTTPTSISITLADNVAYLYIRGYQSGGASGIIDSQIQFEFGETQTTYEPFGTTHIITLPETIYGGTADVVNGNGTKTWIMLNFSDLNFSASNPSSHIFRGDYNGTYKNNIQFPPNPYTATTCITEHYEAMAWQPISGSDHGKFALNDYETYARFVFIDFNYSTQADFETARNNDKIIVPLINPIPFTFTDAKIPTLSGENNIYSNCGDVEVEYFNENADQTSELIDAKQEYANYSSEEKVVGKWIDGSPLYEKTLYFNNVKLDKTDSTSELVHGISNIGSVRFVSEVYFDFSGGVNGWSTANNGLWNDGVFNFYWVCGETSLYILSASGVYFDANPNRSYLVKIRYTKA